jgi:hypothetical protein
MKPEDLDGVLERIARLRRALAAEGGETALAMAQADARDLEQEVARLRQRLEQAPDAAGTRADAEHSTSVVRGPLRASMVEAEKKSLEAQLAALEAASAARVRALEEEVDALLSPSRQEVARSLYELRIGELTASLAGARAQREKLEQLLRGNGEPRSEIELARGGVLVQDALTREAELGARLAEARARLERLRAG